MKKILLYCLFICLLGSCSSRDEDVVEEVPVLPTKTKEGVFYEPYELISSYQYDKNKLKSISIPGRSRVDYFYTGNFITKVNSIDNIGQLFYSTKIEYENDRIKKIIHRYTSEDSDLIITYSWINDNQVRIQDNRRLPENVNNKYIDVFLSNGIVTKNIVHIDKPNQILETTIEYNYDNKNYPFKNIEGFSKIITSELESSPIRIFPQVNNVIKKTSYYTIIENGQTYNSPSSSIDLSYIYDKNGFPTTYIENYFGTEIQGEYNK